MWLSLFFLQLRALVYVHSKVSVVSYRCGQIYKEIRGDMSRLWIGIQGRGYVRALLCNVHVSSYFQQLVKTVGTVMGGCETLWTGN